MTTIASPISADAISPARRWAVLAVVLAAAILDLLDSTITTIAAPTISTDLHGGQALIKWLGAGYALALGVLLVVGGRLGDKFGRRRVFLIGLAGFTLASLGCGLAYDPGSIITTRLIQGAFGALVIPQGFGILATVFPRDQLAKAFSAFAPVLGLSAVGGPILAGFLIEVNLFDLGWRAIFLINIVLGGAAIVAAARLLPRDRGDADIALDGIGAALLAAAMFGLLFGLIEGSSNGWGGLSIASIIAGTVFFVLFCRRQTTARAPLIQPSLLRNRGFTSGLILGVAFYAAVAGLLYVFSLFLQNGLGYSPMRTAIIGIAPIAAGIIVASLGCVRLIARLGRLLILIGLLVTLAGTGLLFFIVQMTGSPPVSPVAFVIGLGMGTCFGTVYDITIGDIDPAEAGSGAGSLSAVQQLANAIGPAVVTTVYFHVLDTSGQEQAMTVSLLVVGGAILFSCALVRLLPRHH